MSDLPLTIKHELFISDDGDREGTKLLIIILDGWRIEIAQNLR